MILRETLIIVAMVLLLSSGWSLEDQILAAREGICGHGNDSAQNDWQQMIRYLYESPAFIPIGGNKGRQRESFELISYMTEEIHEYGAYASACMLWYSRLRNYTMSFYDFEKILSMTSLSLDHPELVEVHHLTQLENNMSLQGDQRWQKVWLLHERIRNIIMHKQINTKGVASSGDYEYVVWVDADVIVLDPHLRLERFCRSFPQSHFIVSRDFKEEHGLINSGFMILRASDWSLRFLEAWWSFDHDRMSDQGAFGRMWTLNSLSVKKYTTLLGPEVLNTRFPAWFNLKPDHKLLHLAGVHEEMRIAVFRECLTRICSLEEDNMISMDQMLKREDILDLLRRTRLEIMSHALTAAAGLEGRNRVGDFRKSLQKALQMGFAGRQRQHELEDSELVDSESIPEGADEDEEIEVAAIALRWASSRLDPSSDDLGRSSAQCEGGQHCMFSEFDKEQAFLDSLFELLDHLRFVPARLRNSAIFSTTAAVSHQGQLGNLLAKAKLLTVTDEGEGTTYSSLVLSSLINCRATLSTLHRRLLGVKPSLPANVWTESLRRLLYYTYKVLDMQASIIGDWGLSGVTQKESLLAALEILCALGASESQEATNPVDIGVSALFALSDDIKEEAAAVMFSIYSIIGTIGDGIPDVTTGVETEKFSVPTFMEEVGTMWNLNFNLVREELTEKVNLPVLAYQLLGEVWNGRVRPKHIETTMNLLEEVMRKEGP